MTISETIDTNFVLWSTIGGGDLLWLFYQDIAESGFLSDGFHDAIRPLMFEQIKRNERGFMPMPWQGTVYNLIPLGNRVIVYGDGGISSLPMVSSPIPTFGLAHLLDIGVASRSAVAIGPSGHVFVDQAGMLRLLDSSFKLHTLGYKEFFKEMLGTDIVGTYDPLEGDYRICNETMGYIWNPDGLCEISQLNTSMSRVADDLVGIQTKTGKGVLSVVTDTFDMKVMGIKFISQIDLRAVAGTAVEIAIDYKYKSGDKFTRSKWKRVNNYGAVFPEVSGIEFRLAIRANPHSDMRYDRAAIKWKLSDKRFVRGVYSRD